ncbi:MAG: 50S ribosomal protein L29 [Simkaniaceae bacterium]|nr:50S ribosomal protein L29 [Simkaniaceae bacterium]
MKKETIEQLEERYMQLSSEIFTLTSELKSLRKLEQPHMLSFKKKERARVLTIMNEKKRGAHEQPKN